MHLHELPSEVIVKVIQYLPHDVLQILIDSNTWLSPIAFKKFYRKMTVMDDPHQFNRSTSYGGIDRPTVNSMPIDFPTYSYFVNDKDIFGPISETVVFGSVYSLVRFINKHPEFVPDEIIFRGILLLLPFTYEFQAFIEKVPRLYIVETDRISRVKSEALHALHKYRSNICGEYYGGEFNTYSIPSEARHLLIPHVSIEDFEAFFQQHTKVKSLALRNLLSCSIDSYPKSLKFISSQILGDTVSKIVLPSTVTHLKLIPEGSFDESREPLDFSSCENLEYLELVAEYNRRSFLKFKLMLPLYLQSLKIDGFVSSDFNKIYHGPNSLTRLELDGTFELKFYHSLFYQSELPSTLKELYITNSSINLQPYGYQDCLLPHPLISGEYAFKIDSNFSLPDCLEVIHLNCPSIAIDSSWKIPDSVRELLLTRVVYFVNFAALLMPENLETLFIESIYGLSFDSYTDSKRVCFPESLMSFTYYGKPIHNLKTNLLELPNLTSLVLASPGLEGFNEPFLINGISVGCSDFQQLQNLRTLELNAIPILGNINMKLPDSLIRFRCAMSEVKGFDETFQFPRHLHELILEQTGIDLNILNKLPPTIEHLELLNCDAIMPNSLDINAPYLRCLVMNGSGIDKETFNLLNLKKYTKLQIVGFQNNRISEIDLSLFPPSVTNVSVYKNHAKIIYGADTDLPNLCNLELSENLVQEHYDDMKKNEVTDAQLVIPERIECLKMRDCSITDTEFVVWPKELGLVRLDDNSISLADLSSLCLRYSTTKCFGGIFVSRDLFDAPELEPYKQIGILKRF